MKSPSTDEARQRYRAWKGILEDVATEALLPPFNRDLRLPEGRIKEPCYKLAAIEVALTAILNDKRDRVLASGGFSPVPQRRCGGENSRESTTAHLEGV